MNHPFALDPPGAQNSWDKMADEIQRLQLEQAEFNKYVLRMHDHCLGTSVACQLISYVYACICHYQVTHLPVVELYNHKPVQ